MEIVFQGLLLTEQDIGGSSSSSASRDFSWMQSYPEPPDSEGVEGINGSRMQYNHKNLSWEEILASEWNWPIIKDLNTRRLARPKRYYVICYIGRVETHYGPTRMDGLINLATP